MLSHYKLSNHYPYWKHSMPNRNCSSENVSMLLENLVLGQGLSSPLIFSLPSFHSCGMLPNSTPTFNSVKLKIIHCLNTSGCLFHCLWALSFFLVDMYIVSIVIAVVLKELWSKLFSSNIIYFPINIYSFLPLYLLIER